jgi:hypothetical protein
MNTSNRDKEKSSDQAYLFNSETTYLAVFRIHRIHVFLGHPDPLVRGMDPDPDPALDPDPDASIIKQI